jgi:hypothetical protein
MDQDRVSKMEIRRRRIESSLDAQGTTLRECPLKLRFQLNLMNHLDCPTLNQV